MRGHDHFMILVAAGASGVLTLIQCAERPGGYGESRFFETSPSSPMAVQRGPVAVHVFLQSGALPQQGRQRISGRSMALAVARGRSSSKRSNAYRKTPLAPLRRASAPRSALKSETPCGSQTTHSPSIVAEGEMGGAFRFEAGGSRADWESVLETF